MEARQNLLRWAKSQGILKDGISFVEISGRGNGIVARRPLKVGTDQPWTGGSHILLSQ